MEMLLKLSTVKYMIVLLPLFIILGFATYTDLKSRKVYNKLTYPSLGIGLFCHTLALGWDGLFDGLLGALALFITGLVLFIGGAMRGGDVKLLTVVGAFVGWYSGFEVFFYAMLTGAVGGLVISTFNGYLIQMFKNMYMLVRSAARVALTGTTAAWETPELDERSWLPFSTWIFLGTILTWTTLAFGSPNLFIRFLNAFRI